MSAEQGMAPFHAVAGDRAWREMRSIRVFESDGSLPPGDYGFVEHYCIDPKCDCRRVLLGMSRLDGPGRIIAMVNFGWEKVGFYARWMNTDEEQAAKMAGASLEPFHSYHPLAEAAFPLTRDTLLQDPDYVARLRRHYREFKRAVRRKKGRLKRF